MIICYLSKISQKRYIDYWFQCRNSYLKHTSVSENVTRSTKMACCYIVTMAFAVRFVLSLKYSALAWTVYARLFEMFQPSQITSLTIVYSTVYSRRRSKKTSKLRVTGLWAGNSPVTAEFPAQKASNAEKVSIWWSHHGPFYRTIVPTVYSIISQYCFR